MHVEIDDGHARQTMRGAGVQSSDRRVVEEAEPHGARGLGMMAGRANGGEGILDHACHHDIYGSDGRAGGSQCGFSAAGTHGGIGVKVDGVTFLWTDRQHHFDDRFRVNAHQLFPRGARRLLPHQTLEFRSVQCFEHGAQTGRGFGMIGAGIVLQASGMSNQSRCHVRWSRGPDGAG